MNAPSGNPTYTHTHTHTHTYTHLVHIDSFTECCKQGCDEVRIHIQQHVNFERFSAHLIFDECFKHLYVKREFMEKSLF